MERRSLPVYAAGGVQVPFVMRSMEERLARDTFWEEHAHPTHELLWNSKGSSTATVGSRTWTITPTLGLWMPAGAVHSGSASAGTWYRATHFGLHAVASISPTPVTVVLTPLLRMLLERLEAPDLTERSRELAELLVMDVLEPAPHDFAVSLPSSALLAPIVERVCADPATAYSLDHWAKRLGVSSRTVTRAFIHETGMGFSRWVQTVRVHHALALLADGEPVEDVARLTGYASASAFTAAFRRMTGSTPGAIRSHVH